MAGISKTKIDQWTGEAEATLREAQSVCTRAQALLQTSGYQLGTQLRLKVEFATFMVDGIKQQFEVLGKIVESIERRVKGVEQLFLEEEKGTERQMEELDRVLERLRQTEVPSFLVDAGVENGSKKKGKLNTSNLTKKQSKTLEDFVSVDVIDLMKENIGIYRGNCRKLHELLKSQLHTTVVEPFHNQLAKLHRKLVKQYDEILPTQLDLRLSAVASTNKSSHDFIGTMFKENTSLENELVSILELIMNHYDQCVQAQQLVNTNTKNKTAGGMVVFNFEVLQTDAVELPEVLKELNTVYEIVLNNESRAQKFLNLEYGRIDAVLATARDELFRFQQFKRQNLTRFMMLSLSSDEIFAKGSVELDSNKTPLQQYSDTLALLVYHYNQFLDVYKTKYLAELFHEQYTYPKMFLNKLSDFLNKDMHQLQAEENDRRVRWISKYGDFIPKEFKLPGEQNQPAVVQVITEGLEDIQENFEQGKFNDLDDENELLNFIRALELS